MHEKFDLFCTSRKLPLVFLDLKAFSEERHFQFYFISFYLQTSRQALTHLTKNPQFLITTNCAQRSRRENPRKSSGIHWLSPVESIYCLAALAVPLQLFIFLFQLWKKYSYHSPQGSLKHSSSPYIWAMIATMVKGSKKLVKNNFNFKKCVYCVSPII